MATHGNLNVHNNLPTIDFSGFKIAIIKTEWNAVITDELEVGAIKILKESGVVQFTTYIVPGAVEVPFAVRAIAQSANAADAYIAFGCVIKGDTPHFEYVCQSITDGITQLNCSMLAPVIYGVLTVNNMIQAMERIGGIHGHKGEEAAITALKMIAFKQGLGK